MEQVLYFVGIILGAAVGQFTVAIGWIVAVLAVLCGFFKRSWLTVQLLAFTGGLIAKFVFAGTAVDNKLGGLAGSLVFNVVVYFLIVFLGYALGWVVMRVARKDSDA